NPRRSDPSNADRRAGGGDRSRPKSSTPFFAPRPGIENLDPGRRGSQPAPSTAELRQIPVPRRGEQGAADEQSERPAIFGPSGGRSDSASAGGAAGAAG